MLALGLLCWPLGMMAGSSMPDRGYILGKVFGLWLIAWIHWVLSSRWFESTAALSVGVALAAGLIAWASVWNSGAPRRMVEKVRFVLWMEALILACMVAGVYVRAMNPAITWAPEGWGAEKCADFAWFNAARRAVHMPPSHPWLAGLAPNYTNYYYFGHLVWALLSKVAGTSPGVDFNIALAALLALSVSAAFVLGWSLTGRRQWGAATVVFLILGGNLQPALFLGAGWASGADALAQAWRDWLYSGWWDASRPIPGAINEFPAFSFLLGDLHAHLSGLPVTLAALMVLLHLERVWRGAGGSHWDRVGASGGALWTWGAFCGLAFVTNSWDAISLLVAALVVAAGGSRVFAWAPSRDFGARLGWLALGFAGALLVAG